MARPVVKPLDDKTRGQYLRLPGAIELGRLYSVREVAHFLDLHIDTVRGHIRGGRCKATFVGGSVGYLVDGAHVRAYLASFPERANSH